MRPVADHYDELEETPWDVMRKAHALGLDATASFPEQYGGGGIDLVTNLIREEEMAWGDAGIATSIGASGLAGTAILAMGTEQQRQKYIGILTGPELKIGAMGLTEPNSGSDSLALETTATKVDGGYVLNGTKQFCTNGGIADYHVIYATPTRRKDRRASRVLPRAKGTPGLRMGRKEQKLGVRASHTAQVILEDCSIPLDHSARLATRAATTPARARRRHDDAGGDSTGVAAGALGIARAAYEFALRLRRRTASSSASRFGSTRRSVSSSPTWPSRLMPRGCSPGAPAGWP